MAVELPAPSNHEEITALLARGRSQYLASEPTLAAQTFTRVLEFDPDNTEAKKFLERITAATSTDGNVGRTHVSAQMLNEVRDAWRRAGAVPEREANLEPEGGGSSLRAKLDAILLPSISFSGLELSRVVNTLSALSVEFDRTGQAPQGVNVVLLDPANTNPLVSLTLRNVSLKRVLDFITDAVGYQYEVQADAVLVRPGGGTAALDTQFFPVSRSAVLRMTGRGAPASRDAAGGDSLAGNHGSGAGARSTDNEGERIKNFLTLAGVTFDEGSSLAFDGSQLIVTQTPRNLGRIRNILQHYHDVRQVEIEAKFMEVQDGALEELGINWSVAKKATQHSGASLSDYATSNRSLAGAFTNSASGTQGSIVRPGSAPTDTAPGSDEVRIPILNTPPQIPGTNNLGVNAAPLAAVTGILGEFNVNAVVRALSQRQGTELLSAPKLTVLSGNPAVITVAQELRYPQSYGQVQSQVGTGSASGGGSAGVAITAGTPQEFTSRNIGVELRVTPTVEEDGHSISLELNPKVTEFEGFVEYGGQSIAIAGNPPTTVTVPPGFFQPIFAVREVTTRVTLWDGATLVMGGLTREDVKNTHDKVPVIGNLPVLGRLFRSSGESAQKRNLLIFVTANLVSPGGALKKHMAGPAGADLLYQNPTVVTLDEAIGHKAVSP
jgi:general secretion pathway protein D